MDRVVKMELEKCRPKKLAEIDYLQSSNYAALVKIVANNCLIAPDKKYYLEQKIMDHEKEFATGFWTIPVFTASVKGDDLVRWSYEAVKRYPGMILSDAYHSLQKSKEFVDFVLANIRCYYLPEFAIDNEYLNKTIIEIDYDELEFEIINYLSLGVCYAKYSGMLKKAIKDVEQGMVIEFENSKRSDRKTESNNKYLVPFEEAFVCKEALQQIRKSLAAEGLIDSGSYMWKDKTQGYKSRVCALVFHLYHMKYLNSSELPSPKQVIHLAQHGFGVKFGTRTAENKKINSLRTNFRFIKMFNQARL